MIVDHLENWNRYPLGAAWASAVDFVMSLPPDAEEKRYSVQGEDLYALVMSYETRNPEPPLFEAHRNYADVQTVLSGGEALEWALLHDLEVESPFDAAKDVAMYHRLEHGVTRVSLLPSTFALLLPHDAHIPALVLADAPEQVKKAVVKIRVDLLTSYNE